MQVKAQKGSEHDTSDAWGCDGGAEHSQRMAQGTLIVTSTAASLSGSGSDSPRPRDGAAVRTSTAVLRSLLRITQALSSEIEGAKAYEAILSVVRDITRAERISIQVLDSDGLPAHDALVLVAGLGLPAGAKIGEARPVAGTIAGWVLHHQRPLLLNGATHADSEIQGLMRAVPGLSAICVPLVVKGRALGVLNASKVDPDHPFHEDDRDFLAVLAGQAAIALDHARLYEQLAQQATLDGLTGLLNHAAFQTRLTAELDRASRMHQHLGLLEIDLDGFKLVNDTYGHPTGDRLLKLIAQYAIMGTIRPYDVAGRPGGDEFAVILPHSTAQQAVTVAERIRVAVATCDTTSVGVPTGMVGASIGVAHFPSDGMRREELVETADNALYFAKYLGRNRVERGSSAVANFERDPRKLHDLLINANTSTVEALAAAIDARDTYTAGHSRRVAEYAGELAQAMGHQERFLNDLRLACLFHDVGKIGVPDAILRKPGKLSEEEFDKMREHPAKGAEMLQRVPSLHKSVEGIRHHHERWDGKGYPDGLAGATIPEMARIIAIADAYDAMTSDRVYRSALMDEDVDRILHSGAGIQWDATLVDIFVKLLEAKRPKTSVVAPIGATLEGEPANGQPSGQPSGQASGHGDRDQQTRGTTAAIATPSAPYHTPRSHT